MNQIRGEPMRREHGILTPISSACPADETIRRGFVDAACRRHDMTVNQTVAGLCSLRSADKTLNFAAVARYFAAVGGFAHS
jgi:hypothetical protein